MRRRLRTGSVWWSLAVVLTPLGFLHTPTSPSTRVTPRGYWLVLSRISDPSGFGAYQSAAIRLRASVAEFNIVLVEGTPS